MNGPPPATPIRLRQAQSRVYRAASIFFPPFWKAILVFFIVAGMPFLSSAQQSKIPETDYLPLIQRATDNETRALEKPDAYQFRERLEWSWGTETRSVIETSEGRTDRIILFGDKPLAPDQQARQKRRLEKLLTDRDAVKSEAKEWQAENQRRLKMLKAFPKACLFEFVEREHGLLRFNFRPNPEFSPKDRETEMYRGMEGILWLEPVQERLVRIEGKLVKDVSFGWGIFGRLNKGGSYEIAQTQLVPSVWRITTMNVDVRGRIFLFGSFRFLRRESNSDFRPTPPVMSYREATQALLSNPEDPKPIQPPSAAESTSHHRR